MNYCAVCDGSSSWTNVVITSSQQPNTRKLKSHSRDSGPVPPDATATHLLRGQRFSISIAHILTDRDASDFQPRQINSATSRLSTIWSSLRRAINLLPAAGREHLMTYFLTRSTLCASVGNIVSQVKKTMNISYRIKSKRKT